jgi:hypothetical protein
MIFLEEPLSTNCLRAENKKSHSEMEQVKKMPLDYFARNDHAFVYSIIYASIHYISARKNLDSKNAHHTMVVSNIL